MMNLKRIGLASLCLAFGLCVSVARAADSKVENPICAAWSKCDVDTSVTLEGDFDPGTGEKVHLVGTYTLKAKNADGVKVDHVAKVKDDKHEDISLWPAQVNKSDCTDTGKTAEIKAMGKAYKCKVYEASGVCVGEAVGGPNATVYICDDMVGGVVEVVLHMPDNNDVTLIATATKIK